MKVALVHDFLNQYGGAEKTLEALHEVFPEAPVFTTIFRPESLPPVFSRMDIRASFMQKLPFLDRHFKKYLLLYPRAVESFDLSGYDVVLSGSSAFAKGARVPAGALHVCYCYTPMRFVWDSRAYLEKEDIPWVLRPLLPPVLAALKRWDLASVGRVHHYVAISEHIRRRIRECYGVDADVIHPPVETDSFRPSDDVSDYYLVVSRLNAYKRIDAVIEAFNRLRRPLRIVGTGPHEPALRRLAGPAVTFLGCLPQEALAREMSRCRALIFPGPEDFGIAPVEAMAAGRPVVAFRGGGATETVREGTTGVFFDAPTTESLAAAVERLDQTDFDPAALRSWARRFDRKVFQQKIRAYVAEKHALFHAGRADSLQTPVP